MEIQYAKTFNNIMTIFVTFNFDCVAIIEWLLVHIIILSSQIRIHIYHVNIADVNKGQVEGIINRRK